MSAANVEVVREVFEAVARRDRAAVLALYDPEVEWDFSDSPIAGALEDKIYRGYEGLRKWWREWHEAWVDYEDRYRELIDAGDQVVAVVTSSGRGRASGVEIEYTQCGVWTIRDGRVLRVVWFSTREEAFAAAGLPK